MIDSIVFSSLVALEFIIFTVAFGSIFVNIFKNPDKDTSKILCVVMVFSLIFLKTIYLPSLLILFFEKNNLLYILNKISLYVLSAWWYLNLVFPNIVALVVSLKTGLGNIRCDHSLYKNKEYNFIVILPVYNEEIDNLTKGVQSLLDMSYNKNKIIIHVSFDEESETELYKKFMMWLCDEKDFVQKNHHFFIVKKDVQIWVHRWEHSGKRGTQGKTFNFIQQDNLFDPNNTIVMLTDSDNYVEDNSFNNLSYYYNKYPDKKAFSGYMSCVSKKGNMVSKLQDSEYCTYELNRFFELLLGTVNCLPGAYTTIKYGSLCELAKDYWSATSVPKSLTNYHRHNLGEDRYLTHLAHKNLPKNSIGLCPVARCKTDPPHSTFSFIKQRRRWLLGALANEMYMITDVQLWKKYPLLLVFKVFQNALRFTITSQITILYTSIKTMLREDLVFYLGFVLSPLVFVWLLSFIVSIRIKRIKVFLLWPLMMVYYIITHLFIDVYTVLTWNEKSWGTR